MNNIPRYKRDKFIFISNLQEVTANQDHPITLKREGYLLSEKFTNAQEESRALWVKKRRNLLVSDNGNFSRMKAVAKLFKDEGSLILNQAISELEADGAVSKQVHDERLALIKRIEDACWKAKANTDLNKIIERQIVIKPDYLIGLEDFTIPVLMMCSLMHPVFKPQASAVKIYQQHTQTLYQNQVDGQFGNKKALASSHNFLVLHAYDFASALQGVQQLPTQPDGIAISYGGPMTSKRWISELILADTTVKFDEKLPEPYLISTAITLGVAKGLASDIPIHILGVGTPILIALIGQLLNQTAAISIDSTAPFKDAYAGTLYGSRSAFLKMNMYKVAAYSLVNNKAYTSRTPFFKRFEQDFPSNWPKMRSELAVSSNSNINAVIRDLKSNPSLIEANIPFFSKMRSGNSPLIDRLRMDRSGHNYWILRNICVSIRRRKHDPVALEKWMRYQVNRYISTGSRKWGLAVQAAFNMSISKH